MRLRSRHPALELAPLADTEAVLLIDNGQTEAGDRDALLDDGVGTDQDVDVAVRERGQDLAALGGAGAASEQGHRGPVLSVERGVQATEVVVVLLGEDLGRRHHGRLVVLRDGHQCRGGGDDRLAAPDVTLEEARHGPGETEVAEDFVEGSLLRTGE